MLRIGTRGSDLARWQAERVRELLGRRGVTAEIVIIRTSGDAPGPRPTGLAVKGLFTKELEEALLGDRVDLAVHSLKDLMVELPEGLVLGAVPERGDPRDALVTRDGCPLERLAAGARVGSSSVRRRAALRAARPDLTVVQLRGNVPTRVRRVEEGRVAAAVLALAGLKRLGLDRHAAPLDPAVFVPAPGQGALAIETRADDRRVRAAVHPLDEPDTRVAVDAERAALAGLGTGCNVPIGAHCRRTGHGLELHVVVWAVDGSRALETRVPVNRDGAAAGRAAAAELLAQGAGALIAAARAAVGGGTGGSAR